MDNNETNYVCACMSVTQREQIVLHIHRRQILNVNRMENIFNTVYTDS